MAKTRNILILCKFNGKRKMDKGIHYLPVVPDIKMTVADDQFISYCPLV